MATRFFLTDDATAPAVSPTISATDWLHINTVRRKLLSTADSSTLVSTAYTPDAGDDLVIGNAHHRQYVSDPLGAQAILSSSTVQAQFQALEAHANNNLSLTLKVYTVDSTGAFKSALLAIVGKGTEPTTSLRNTGFAATALNGSGGTVTVAEGDRIVVEIGLGGTPTATSGTQGHNGTIRWGCNASSGDLPVDETQAATTYRPWVEFSANLVFSKTAAPAADALGSGADALDADAFSVLANARGFGATLGSASTDKIVTALTSHATQRTYAFWLNHRTGTNNRIFAKQNNGGTQIEHFLVQDSTHYRYLRSWSGGDNNWDVTFGAVPLNAWHHWAITYDAGNVNNDPLIYYDGVSQTVTQSTGPTSGTVVTNTDPYHIGNRGAGDRVFDGMIQDFAVWDRILSGAEIADIATPVGGYSGKSPALYPTNLVEYIALNDNPVTSRVLANPTVTGTAVQTGLSIYFGGGLGATDLTAALGPDALGSYDDAVSKEHRTLPGWNDSATTFLSGVTPISVNLPADSLGLYLDQTLAILFTAAVVLSPDSLGLYADPAPSIVETYRAAPSADSLGLYLDQTPAILFTAAVVLPPDSLGLYADQSPTIREGLLTTPPADALPAYADSTTGFFTLAARPSDDLNQWLDQPTVSTGTGLIQITPPADSLGLYADPAPTVREGLLTGLAADPLPAYADTSNGFFTLAVRPSEDINQWVDQRTVSTGTGSIQAQPSADSLNNWLDAPTNLLGEFVAPSADAMALLDQLSVSLSVVKTASFTDPLSSYADQINIAAQKIGGFSDALGSYSDALGIARRINVARADALANYTDQVAGGAASLTRLGWQDSLAATTLPIRLGWQDSLTVSQTLGTVRSVNLTSARPIPQDSISEGYGYHVGAVVYLVDGLGNYIVDENGNRIIAAGLIDNLAQGDSVAITRTTLATTPRLVSITDALPIYADAIQVSRGIVTLDAPLSDTLPSYSDALIFVELVGLLVFSSTDALGGYSDSIPGVSTSGEKRVDQSDALANYGDSTQVRQIGNITLALTDALGGYADAAAINTSGGLSVSLTDALPSYSDSTQVQQGGILSVSLIEALGGSFGDARAITLGIRKAASDNLAGYGDSPTHGRGLLYRTPADGLANYLDLVTAGGLGQLQAALSDNLGQYNDGPPAIFANMRAQPPADDLAAYADTLGGLFALNFELFDGLPPFIRLRDFLDARVGLFNELRYGLSDDLNQWADTAAYSRVFYAIRLSGNVTERITLTGKVIEEQIGLNGKLDDTGADISGELYIGET